ncbi:YqaJ viral recombinase family protein [Mycolicibacterium komossense]|uniref:YqaJ viral recombinase family protein n=1 Tax=Mycolicibacterium komossense TaxID=1779 RepID=A0ABT3CMD3_9MYCO|nr:YqaJ viral recombinase family protein [Mycolicibacterium komossense]MCV7230714.1 YqaJ viral recombinase family protein [Mycolicibacterium komossense]
MSIRHIGVYTPRDPEWIQPGSEQHRAMISPSKVGAILGLSRWESPFSLWNRMKGLVPPEEPKDAFDLGHDVEDFAAKRWRRRQTERWLLSPGEVQFIVDPEHFGFPAMVTLDRRAVRGQSRRVVEFKMARDQNDADKWGDDGSGNLPPDYFAQVLTAMLFTGWTDKAGHLLCVGPRIGDERLYQVEYDADARAEASFLINECRRFHESLSNDDPPPLDKSPATYDCIKALHPDIDGTTVDIDPDEALDYAEARVAFAAADDELNLQRNRLLKRMEQAQYANLGDPKHGGIQVARRQPGSKGGVSFYPSKSITPDKVRALTGGNTDD